MRVNLGNLELQAAHPVKGGEMDLLNHLSSRVRDPKVRLLSAVARLKTPIHPNSAAPIVITVRYSLLLTHYRVTWLQRLSKGRSLAEYRAELFCNRRMRQRLRLLQIFVLPSLASQTLPMKPGLRELNLLISTELPAEHLKALRDGVAPYAWVNLVPVAPDVPRLPVLSIGDIFASVRLDDDDALSRGYLERLSGYVRGEYAGRVITFPHGIFGKFTPQTGWEFMHSYSTKTAQGLAYIVSPETSVRSIYELGGHPEVDRFASLIMDNYGPAYLRTIYDGQITWAKNRPFKSDLHLKPEVVQRFIGFDDLSLYVV